MTRKEEIRNVAITTIELLKGFTPEQRETFPNSTRTMEELANLILELTAPESSPPEKEINTVKDMMDIQVHLNPQVSLENDNFVLRINGTRWIRVSPGLEEVPRS